MEKKEDRITAIREKIMEELFLSRDHRSAIGIWSATLGRGMFLCFVKELVIDEDEDDVVIILSEHDPGGAGLENHVLYLNEIERIYKFRAAPNPTLKVKNVDADSDNI